MSAAIVDVPRGARVTSAAMGRAYIAAEVLREGLTVGATPDDDLRLDAKLCASMWKRKLSRAELARRRRLSR